MNLCLVLEAKQNKTNVTRRSEHTTDKQACIRMFDCSEVIYTCNINRLHEHRYIQLEIQQQQSCLFSSTEIKLSD